MSKKLSKLKFDNLNLKFEHKKYGEITIKFISFQDYKYISKFVFRKGITDKDFAIKFLEQQILSPLKLKTTLKELSNEELLKIVSKVIRSDSRIFDSPHKPSKLEDSFKSLRESIKSLTFGITNFQLDIKNLLPKFSTEMFQLKTIDRIEESFRSLNSIARLAEESTKFTEIFEDSVKKQIDSALRLSDSTKKILDSIGIVNDQLQRFSSVNFDALTGLTSNIQSVSSIISDSWGSYFKVNELLKENYFKTLSVDVKSLTESVGIHLEVNRNIFESKINDFTKYPSLVKEEVTEVVSGSISELEDFLLKIKNGILRHGINGFWEKKGTILRKKPEQIGQSLLATNLYAIVPREKYILNEQPQIASGRIDIVVSFFNGTTMQQVVLEVKVLDDKDSDPNIGIQQTFEYLHLKEVNLGYRLIYNANRSLFLEEKKHTKGSKVVKDIVINIDPVNPSKL